MKFGKYIHVLELLHTIPRKEGKTWDGKPLLVADMTFREALAVWDHLFDYIHTNWMLPATSDARYVAPNSETAAELQECRELLDATGAKEIEERLEKIPPHYSEALFPVAVGRFLLRELQLPFNYRMSTTFGEFHRRYGRMILDF